MGDNNSYVAEDALLTQATITVTAESASEAFMKALDIVDGWAAKRNLTVSIERYTIEHTGQALRKTDQGRYTVAMF